MDCIDIIIEYSLPVRPNPPAGSPRERPRTQGPAPQPPKNRERNKPYSHMKVRSEGGEVKSKATGSERVQLESQVSKDANVKPKRQAPPPPRKVLTSTSDDRVGDKGSQTPPPAYASVVKPHRQAQGGADGKKGDVSIYI